MAEIKDRENALIMETTKGKVVIELFPDLAPGHVGRIKELAREGAYDGVVFHRVIDGFMIQGGGFTKNMDEKPTAGTIVNEAKNGLKNERGTISMARRGDPDSASSQFFINHRDNSSSLNYPRNGGGYAVFGKVVSGMEIVDKIAKLPTGNRGMHQNVPLEAVVIESVKITPDK